MNKLIGLRVYCATYGEGEILNVNSIGTFPIKVKFDLGIRDDYTIEGAILEKAKPTLSLTPYTLENGGFTPLSEFSKPKVGDWGYFWDEEDDEKSVLFGKLIRINEESEYIYEADTSVFKYFSHTPPEFIKDKILKSIKLAQ